MWPLLLALQLAVVDVSVVHVDHDRAGDEANAVTPHQTVLIADGRVVSIVNANQAELPPHITRIDGSGRFLVPGYTDMHVHLDRNGALVDGTLELLLAHGVTYVRNMSSGEWPDRPAAKRAASTGTPISLEHLRDLQRNLDAGAVLGPRILALGSAPVAGGNPNEAPVWWQPSTYDQGYDLALRLHASGVDFIKCYDGLSRSAFLGLAKGARETKLPLAGHLPWSVDPAEAARAGLRSLEHARLPALACTPHWKHFRAAYDRYVSGETSRWPSDHFRNTVSLAVEDFEPELAASVFRALRDHDVYLCPTLTTRAVDARAHEPDLPRDWRRQYVPARMAAQWDQELRATASVGTRQQMQRQRFFEHAQNLVGQAYDAHVKILVGTDANDTQCFAGFAFHEETQHLAAAGLTPLAVLRAATLTAAEFFELEDAVGKVQPGYQANLVLLGADPRERVEALANIEGVIRNGEWLSREDLEALKNAVALRLDPVTRGR